MSFESYKKAHAEYRKLADAAAKGDAKAKEEKQKVFQDVRAMERDAAKSEGVVLSGGKKIAEGAPTKRSLQDAYIRRFDDKTKVELEGADGEKKVTTLRDHHKERLQGK